VKWGVAAPGDIVMLLSNGVQLLHEGTSVAAPNVAGAVALLLAHGETRDTAVQRLVSTAIPCSGCGHGRIDAAGSLGVQPAPPAPTRPQGTVPSPTTVPPPPPVELTVPDPSLLDQAPPLADLFPAPNP
jgi:subtilisin family serine protease